MEIFATKLVYKFTSLHIFHFSFFFYLWYPNMCVWLKGMNFTSDWNFFSLSCNLLILFFFLNCCVWFCFFLVRRFVFLHSLLMYDHNNVFIKNSRPAIYNRLSDKKSYNFSNDKTFFQYLQSIGVNRHKYLLVACWLV